MQGRHFSLFLYLLEFYFIFVLVPVKTVRLIMYLNSMHLRRLWTAELQFSRFSHSALNYMYSRITSTKSRSSCMTTFSVSLTKLKVLLPCSRDSSRRILVPPSPSPPPDCKNTLFYSHMNSCTLQTCDISLGSLSLPAPDLADFVESILLFICRLCAAKNSSCNPLRTDRFVIYTDDWS
jgi:hypothetical protein